MRIEILDKSRNEVTFLTAGKLKREKEERLMKQDAKIMHLKERKMMIEPMRNEHCPSGNFSWGKSRRWWMVRCYI